MLPTNLGQTMHSSSALSEHVSMNFEGTFLFFPPICASVVSVAVLRFWSPSPPPLFAVARPITLPRLCTAINRPRKKRREGEREPNKSVPLNSRCASASAAAAGCCTVGRSSVRICCASVHCFHNYLGHKASHTLPHAEKVNSVLRRPARPRYVCH